MAIGAVSAKDDLRSESPNEERLRKKLRSRISDMLCDGDAPMLSGLLIRGDGHLHLGR